ncbi:hypothetical protein CDEF62S_03668 [Castellaniella defragrans]
MDKQLPPSKGTTKLMDRLYSGPSVTVWREVLAVGETLAWHYHSHVSDTFYVVRGPLRVASRNPDACVDIETGGLYQLAPGIQHQVSNTTDGDVEWILVQGVGDVDYHEVD